MKTPARRNHKSPRGWKSYAFGAAAAVALLAATACDPGAAEGSDGSEPSAQPSATASAKPGGVSNGGDGAGSGGGSSAGNGGGTDSGGGTSSAGSGGTTSSAGTTGGKGTTGSTGTGRSGGTAGGGGGGKATIATCSQKELGVSAVKERDFRHLVLTVQNASDKKCNLYRYPIVKLGAEARFTTPVIKDSDGTPGVPVTLSPGQEAYAALLVSSGNTGEYEAKSITLGLQGSTPGSSAGNPIDVPMPVSTLYADKSQLVTYWTTASGFALDFIMSK
ncbi:DUF4232 domain-containing protein [Streptomyces sp. NPDC059371]|uniref:DUF4232 domain-containing protein n=1 Tax=Streptomyces sp. NPDC059371 TaxID=3346812 RepID=UPI0036871C1B